MGTERFENVIIVTRRTELEELVARFNTRSQAEFYLRQAGQEFAPVEDSHNRHQAVLERLVSAIPPATKHQVIDRDTVPRFSFGDDDLVVAVGQDGLVSNTAKYLDGQPLMGVNPDPARYDGVLLPYSAETVAPSLGATLRGDFTTRDVTLAQASLQDGQHLLAFNDLFIGARSHVSARYEIHVGQQTELQSSSGIIVSTGAGSTGWLQSVYAGAAGVIRALGGEVIPPPNGGRLPWDSRQLVFAVREPFPSVATQCALVYGQFGNEEPFRITSKMASHGVVFSDGMESDYLEFNSGAELTIGLADKSASLVYPAAS